MKNRRQISLSSNKRDPLVFNQKIDHFNTSDTRTFNQTYLENTDFYNDSHILIIYIEGEGALRENEVDSNYQFTLASDYKAALYALEHRFYGSSQPFGTLSVDNLKYLSTEQALADAAEFLNAIIVKFEPPYDIRKVVVIGGSYAGVVSSLFRAFHPEIVSISLASSAPVNAVADFYEYDEVIASALGPECAGWVRLALQDLEDTANVNLADAVTQLGCNPASFSNEIDFLATIADVPSGCVQYNTTKLCIPTMCDALNPQHNPSNLTYGQRFYDFTTREYFPVIENCTCEEFASTREGFSNESTANAGRAWFYQTCTEFGYFQTAPRNDSLRSTQITVDYYLDMCGAVFNNRTTLDTDATNTRFGGTNSFATNVIFTNGLNDPWHVLGITNTSEYGTDGQVGRKNWTVLPIADGSHCTDLHTPDPAADSENLTDTRLIIKNTLDELLTPITIYAVDDAAEEEKELFSVLGLVMGVVLLVFAAAMFVVGIVLAVCMQRTWKSVSSVGEREFGEGDFVRKKKSRW